MGAPGGLINVHRANKMGLEMWGARIDQAVNMRITVKIYDAPSPSCALPTNYYCFALHHFRIRFSFQLCAGPTLCWAAGRRSICNPMLKSSIKLGYGRVCIRWARTWTFNEFANVVGIGCLTWC